jgi:hypothetical protein
MLLSFLFSFFNVWLTRKISAYFWWCRYWFSMLRMLSFDVDGTQYYGYPMTSITSHYHGHDGLWGIFGGFLDLFSCRKTTTKSSGIPGFISVNQDYLLTYTPARTLPTRWKPPRVVLGSCMRQESGAFIAWATCLAPHAHLLSMQELTLSLSPLM